MKRWFKYVLAAIIVLVILGIAYEVKGQGCPDDYGCAQFYRSDCYSRDGLIEHWTLDPGVQGSILIQEQDYGDFETWTGAEGGCTDCPEGWGCDCTSFGGDIDQEATLIYKTDTSVNITPAGNLSGLFVYIHTFQPNEVYQFSFCYMGAAGTEDLQFGVGNVAFTDSYNWATDAFTAPLTVLALANIGTTWTCANAYMTVGAAAKAGYLVAFSASSADGTAIYIDNVRFERVSAEGVTGSRGNVLSVPVTSDQQWGHSEVLLPRTGTGPAYKTGMKLDGVDDYLYCADADCEMDPINWAGRGYFSVGCRVITDTVAAGQDFIITKWNAAIGNQRSWTVRRNAADLEFFISDDGINLDFNGVGMFTADALHSFVSTFDPSGGSGACVNNLYYNAYQVDIDGVMTECAPFDSASDLQIGALVGAATWSGSMLECTLWEKELTAIEANKYISPHFPATNHGDGFYVDTCSQAASHATCSTQVCRDGTPNACQAEGTGAMALFGQYSETVIDNSGEAYAGDPSVANWPDWTETEITGDGTSAITAYLADSIHKLASFRLAITGTTSSAQIDQCIACSDSTAYYAYGKFRELDGASTMDLTVEEHDDGTCTSLVATNAIAADVDVPEVWTEYGAGFTTTGTTASCKFIVLSDTTTSDFLVDFVSLKAANYRTPPVENPTGGVTTTYNSRDNRLHNPLSDFSEAEQKYGYEDGFCVSMWVFTDWDGTGAVQHYMIQSPGTVGNNNLWFIRKTTRFEFRVYTAAGVATYRRIDSTADNWTAGYFKYIEACHDNAGTTRARHYDTDDGTWYDWVETSGNAVQDGASTELHIGHATSTSYLDGYQSVITISPYSDIWPLRNFHNGRAPINHHPY